MSPIKQTMVPPDSIHPAFAETVPDSSETIIFPYYPVPRLFLGPLILTIPRFPDWLRRAFRWLQGLIWILLILFSTISALDNEPLIWFQVTIFASGFLIFLFSPIRPSLSIPQEIRVNAESFQVLPATPRLLPIHFSDILYFKLSPSHLEINHSTISGISRFRLFIHDIHPADWERLCSLFLQRTRILAPRAHITTPGVIEHAD